MIKNRLFRGQEKSQKILYGTYPRLLIFCVLFVSSCSFPTPILSATIPVQEPTPIEGLTILSTPSSTTYPTDIPEPAATTTSIVTIEATSPPVKPITIENVDSITPIFELDDPSGVISEMSFSPDGSTLAIAAADINVHVWNVVEQTQIQSLEGHTARIQSVAFSPDGSLLASGSWDDAIIIWRTDDWSQVRKLEAHNGFVNALAFSPDGALLASGGEDDLVIVWNVADWNELYRLEEQILPISSVVFSPNGEYIAAASGQTTARIWNVSDGSLYQSLVGLATVKTLAYVLDGDILAGGSWNTTNITGVPLVRIIFWDTRDGSRFGVTEETTQGLGFAASIDGSLLISSLSSGEVGNLVQIWDPRDGTLLSEFNNQSSRVFSIAVSPDGQYFATGAQDGYVIIWGVVEN